jgi:tellurite resistance protein TerA
MTELIRGQKLKLTDLTPALQLEVGLKAAAPAGQSIDISCFGLDADGKLSDDRYFIFYNQKNSPCGSLTAQGASGGDNEVFRVDLGKLPQSIRRLVFVATLDGSASMSALGPSHLRIVAQGQNVARFAFDGSAFGAEKAVMIAEVYFKDQWRVAAVGQGFAGGLSAVLKHFGGSEASAPAPSAPPPAAAAAPPAAAPPAAAPSPAEPPKVNLGKVSLDKRGSKLAVNVTKGGSLHQILMSRKWEAPS